MRCLCLEEAFQPKLRVIIEYVDPKSGNTKRYTPGTFGLGFRVTEEMYEDSLYGIMRKMPKGLAKAQANTVELHAISVLDDAFGAAGIYTGLINFVSVMLLTQFFTLEVLIVTLQVYRQI